MMNKQEIDAALSAANPIGRAAAARLPLEQAEGEFLAAIMAEAQEPALETRSLTRTRRGFGRYVALGGVATAALALFLIAIATGGGSGGAPAPAFGAELVRFANSSPLVLIGAPGWHVEDVQESSAEEGQMTFVHGDAPMPIEDVTVEHGEARGMLAPVVRQRQAQLNWRPGSLAGWVRDRAASAEISTSAPVLDTTAQVFQYLGGSPGNRDITALWEEGSRVFEFRSPVPDMAVFEERLAALEKVDATAWLSALPPSVVRAADHGTAVKEMLKGIPLPPGFDAAKIPDAGLTTNRYQLGATVAGAVACTWFQDWARAHSAGDEEDVQAAIAAMATAKDWPILREMSKRGAYSQIVEEFAAAMPSGRWYGRPLIGDVNSGLGCANKGVHLWRNPELE